MQLGVCGNPEIAGPAEQAGFDYFEWSVGGLLKPLEDEDAFLAALEQVQQSPLTCPVVNVFVPGHLKITGPEVDEKALQNYVKTTCRRSETAGVKVIVFGSGAARQIPAGFSREAAWGQLVDFCRMLAPLAEQHGVTIAIEPLNRAECNVVNTVKEGAQLAMDAGHPAIRLLVDAYHWAKDHDSIEDLVQAGPLLAHAHIATLANRRPPGIEQDDFSAFFGALKRNGFNHRISIEASIHQAEAELPQAYQFIKGYAND
jgi:sugar phosphate isomerase/epimerase